MRKPLLLLSGVLCAAVGVGAMFWFVSRSSKPGTPIEVSTPVHSQATAQEPAQLAARESVPVQPPPPPAGRRAVEPPKEGALPSRPMPFVEIANPVPELVVDADAAGSTPPKGGVAESLVPVTGGEGACAAAYKSWGPEARQDRVKLLEAAIAEYTQDPKEPEEVTKYQALKEELLWLRGHPGS